MPYKKKKNVIKKKKLNGKDYLRYLSPINLNKREVKCRSPYQCTGLLPREKCYVINCCQSKISRYRQLKIQATNAMRENKIFTIHGNCKVVKKALVERGWVEKIPKNAMNLNKIRNGTITNKNEINYEIERLLLSNLVEKHNANFVWKTNVDRDTTIDMDNATEDNTITNKLEKDGKWTSKQGLCSLAKENYWFTIENVAEVVCPRTYNSYDLCDIEEFKTDFYITACTSLLKWIPSIAASNKLIIDKTGTIPLKVLRFAINRCKEYILRKHHKDIDYKLNCVSVKHWKAFMHNYYHIVTKGAILKAEKDNDLYLYIKYAKLLLRKIQTFRPQFNCEGCYNIWIIKPGHCSRGRGISMASDLGTINKILTKASDKYVIQKYIEEPLLIYNTKFDIRQYYLVTSTYPLVIWMYKDCYLKFSSQKYNLKDFHESIHLTNNAVQRKYENCSHRHCDLPLSNMWDLCTYKKYLINNGNSNVWDTITYPGMKKSIIGIMLSCQDSLSVTKNRFELYGCDFILDAQYQPWLIEINSCPDLKHTTPITAKICPAVIQDTIKVVLDQAENPTNSSGKFECIYRQPITAPQYTSVADLFVQGHALPQEYFCKGNIIPNKESYDGYQELHRVKLTRTLEKESELYENLWKEDEELSETRETVELERHQVFNQFNY